MLSNIIFKKWLRLARENQQVGCITDSRNLQKHQFSNWVLNKQLILPVKIGETKVEAVCSSQFIRTIPDSPVSSELQEPTVFEKIKVVMHSVYTPSLIMFMVWGKWNISYHWNISTEQWTVRREKIRMMIKI